ncbi:triacylglycerol lipase [Pseudomonas sp. UMAB-40]|uniref:esterase/lipase family protein n=1 Tax=Pseudomonas sp. UMAB-40 TaxID=1365407 RepID=UPI001C5660C4|nr:GPI inositol-deacylase [Pseudomonas sp. UMAB-40]
MPHGYPIIYIRGYAMTVDERNETAADPFCGFNVGSTLYRATANKAQRPEKFVFESPLVRLTTEYQYQHVYQNGLDIMDEGWEPPKDDEGKPIPGIPPRSIVILRYYDDGSIYLGDGNSRNIEEYARRLNALILKIKTLVCQYREADGSVMDPKKFQCYLVAHSMGGLVARAFLQSIDSDFEEARRTVNKLFTFATPHNGIDVLGLNVPSWLTDDQKNTFNRDIMARYLNLQDISHKFKGRVDLIPEGALKPERIFCMVGTNRGDYEVAQGVVRAFVGNGSDGLVRIDNASLWGLDENLKPVQVATAYAYRSHSGYFGIVNSEEAYQNLVRFLFGDVRVDISLLVESVSLPEVIQKEVDDHKKLEAGYQFEFRAAPKGKRWFLTRRQSIEDSPACRSHEELTGPDTAKRTVYLSSVFLSKRGKVDKDKALSYVMTFAAKVPDYIINHRFWPDAHYEGTDLFRGTAIVKLTPPENANGDWNVSLAWMEDPHSAITKTVHITGDDFIEIDLPFDQPRAPGIKGLLRLKVRPWD